MKEFTVVADAAMFKILRVKGYHTNLGESTSENKTIIKRHNELYKIEQANKVAIVIAELTVKMKIIFTALKGTSQEIIQDQWVYGVTHCVGKKRHHRKWYRRRGKPKATRRAKAVLANS